MGERLDIITRLHQRTNRDYLARMVDDKVHCMEQARKYGKDFWDGDRRYGYGGYRYDGRWSVVAEALIARHNLEDGCSILDVGCGKGFLLFEFKQLLPNARVCGFDISRYAIEHAKEEVRPYLRVHDAGEPFPFADNEFDLAVSITTLHNLPIDRLGVGLSEVARVSRRGYIAVESFRSSAELFNLQCWALTCEAFHRPEGWEHLFAQNGYDGDYEFIYFE